MALRRSSRERASWRKSIPIMKGQRHDEGVHGGVGFPEAAANNLAAAQGIPSILPPDVYDTVRRVLHIQTSEGEPIFSKMSEEDCDAHIMGVLMAEHYSMKKAKELFGDSAYDAIMKELKQIHLFETYEPLKASELSWEEKKEALNSLLFVTEKRNRDIKARNVADGSKQRTFEGYEKKDEASRTVLTESVRS